MAGHNGFFSTGKPHLNDDEHSQGIVTRTAIGTTYYARMLRGLTFSTGHRFICSR